jgi:predicted DNA-binding transcriptional regulator
MIAINMADDRVLGWIICLGSLAGIVIYFWLLFMSPWAWLTIQVSALLAVGMVLLIMAWIGYTLATTPPPMPLEDFDFESETVVSEPESETEEEASE